MLTREEAKAEAKIWQTKDDVYKRDVCLQIAVTYPDCVERDKILKQAERYAKSEES